MATAWILVANGSEARLFERKGKEWSLLESFYHPDSRRKDTEITSDHLGHEETQGNRTEINTKAYGSFPETTDPHDYEIDRFARELAHHLDNHRARSDFDELVVVAPPRFHGRFNRHRSRELAACVAADIEKDYTKVPERELPERLAPHLK